MQYSGASAVAKELDTLEKLGMIRKFGRPTNTGRQNYVRTDSPWWSIVDAARGALGADIGDTRAGGLRTRDPICAAHLGLVERTAPPTLGGRPGVPFRRRRATHAPLHRGHQASGRGGQQNASLTSFRRGDGSSLVAGRDGLTRLPRSPELSQS